MPDDDRRARAARLIAEIHALKIGGGGDYDNVRRLRSDKIAALAERLSYELPPQYTLLHVVKRLDSLTREYPMLLNSSDQVRAERTAGPPSDDVVRGMSAAERLAHANRIAYLLANAREREDKAE